MFHQMMSDVEQIVDAQLQRMENIKSKELGLDPRGSYELLVSEDGVAISTCHAGVADYYMGFEYIDSENRVTVGEYTFFSVEDSRILDIVTRAKDLGYIGGHEQDEEEEDDEE